MLRATFLLITETGSYVGSAAQGQLVSPTCSMDAEEDLLLQVKMIIVYWVFFSLKTQLGKVRPLFCSLFRGWRDEGNEKHKLWLVTV